MSFEVRRPVKLSRRITRNFASRDWTSIGRRRTHATLRTAGIRASLSSLSDPSYMHTDESRVVGFDTPATNARLVIRSSPEKDWSDWLWLGLVMFAIAAVAAVQVMQ